MMKKPAIADAMLSAIVVATILKIFCFDFIITEGESMSPAIKNGTLLFVNKLSYGFRPPFSRRYLVRWAAPKKNDVVLFYTPYGDLAVKRCADLIDDAAFSETRWIAHGDNTAASFDSRSYGPLTFDCIIGRAVGY